MEDTIEAPSTGFFLEDGNMRVSLEIDNNQYSMSIGAARELAGLLIETAMMAKAAQAIHSYHADPVVARQSVEEFAEVIAHSISMEEDDDDTEH